MEQCIWRKQDAKKIFSSSLYPVSYTHLVVQKEGILLAGFGLQEIPAAEKQQEEIHMALSYLTDEEAATVSGLYPEWKPDTRYQTGERAAYQDMLYLSLIHIFYGRANGAEIIFTRKEGDLWQTEVPANLEGEMCIRDSAYTVCHSSGGWPCNQQRKPGSIRKNR